MGREVDFLEVKKVYITEFFEEKYVTKIRWFSNVRFVNKLIKFNFILLKYPYFKIGLL